MANYEGVYSKMQLSENNVRQEIERCKSIIEANTHLLNEGDRQFSPEIYSSVIGKATKDLLYLESLSH